MQTHVLRCLIAGAIVGSSGAAQAALFDRGGGLIYDDVLNVTWLQDANYAMTSGYDIDGLMSFADANTWAADLVYYDSVRNVSYDDWRLPTVSPVNGIRFDLQEKADGSADTGYNITGTNNELSYMFYVNLGNPGHLLTNGAQSGCYVSTLDTCLNNAGMFTNLQAGYYWQNGTMSAGSSGTWHFLTHTGAQHFDYHGPNLYAWAVRPGDVAASAVPVPAAAWLFGSGLLGLVGVARRRTV